nr:hypothetical protein [Candidatus Korarchaeota archaeon]NIU82145.1 hypothetical protein [Candidatus Thorarchaeota archaeon]NIW12588.1 hypothetical protein [Candidatus Thorarchaeota archaeon]NIW51399.1 hypothetical protein [Candidatus Korarchaeota archaeon]
MPDRYREYPYRIVREYHEEYTIDYDDFVIKGYTNKQTMEVVELVGNDYLKEKERILTTESNREVSIRRLGFFRKETAGIPHWVWIGTAVAVVALGVNV